jgi:hypothetical protein
MVVGLLQLDWWDVAAVLEQAAGVEFPCHPFLTRGNVPLARVYSLA